MTSIPLVRFLFLCLGLLSIQPDAVAQEYDPEISWRALDQESAVYSNEAFDTQGEHTEVGSEESVAHPVFLGNREVTVHGEVGDLFAGGETITIEGHVVDNAFIGARTLLINGTIGGDLFVFAEEVTIAGRLEGDLFGAFKRVLVTRTGSIGGDVHATGERISVEGRVDGRLVGAAERVRVDGTIGQDVLLAARSIELTANAEIGGDLQYDSRDDPMIRTGAVVHGATRRVRYDDEVTERREFALPYAGAIFRLGAFLLALIVGGLCLAIGRETALLPSRWLSKNPAQGLGVGFLVFVLTLVVAFVFFIMCITAPISLVLLVALSVGSYLGALITAECLGRWVLGLFVRQPNAFLCLLLGVMVYSTIGLVPYLGAVVHFFWDLAGLGALFLVLRGSRP